MAETSNSSIRMSDVVSALSVALDLTEGQPMGHAIRSCFIGMRIAKELRLPAKDCADLYYALLLKDSGCSSNSARLHGILGSDDIQAKREVKFQDWTRMSLPGLRYLLRNTMPGAHWFDKFKRIVQVGLHQSENNAALIGTRCERGAEIARKIGMSERTALAIRSLDEHWNGGGYPEGRAGDHIPLLSRIMNVSQTLEVFASEYDPEAAIRAVSQRSGKWFDPEMVNVARSLLKEEKLWQQMKSKDVRSLVMGMEPGTAVPASPERIDSICQAFAEVIDAKSPYTFNHSLGVANASVAIAEALALAPIMITTIRRAALLHDIGKLSVSNAILEKPGKLTDSEWEVMKMHPVYSRQILKSISGFENLAFIAAAHHERLDGKGYPEGLKANQLPLAARVIAVADVYQALTEKRPYREGLSLDVVMKMLHEDVPARLDAQCVAALQRAKVSAPRELVQAATAR
jgi:putative nucleotidyltransferase with HDIG domain